VIINGPEIVDVQFDRGESPQLVVTTIRSGLESIPVKASSTDAEQLRKVYSALRIIQYGNKKPFREDEETARVTAESTTLVEPQLLDAIGKLTAAVRQLTVTINDRFPPRE
jgi:hypothetical protein